MGMGLVVTSSKEDFYQQIQQVIYAKADDDKAVQLFHFVQAFFDKFPLAELADRDIQDVFGMMSNCFDQLNHFTRKSPKIRVYSPTLKRDGWKSDNTVIIVIHRDMPFLVDSIRLALINYGVEIHTLKSSVISTKRDENSVLQGLHLSSSVSGAGDEQSLIADNEAVMYFEISRHVQQDDAYTDLIELIENVLADVRLVIKDYKTILSRLSLITDGLVHAPKTDNGAYIEEYRTFVGWLKQNSFTFLGYAYYTVDLKQEKSQLKEALGLLSDADNLNNFIADINHNKGVLTFSKSFIRSRVHRHAYPDHIVIRHYDKSGTVCGEHHLLGLYTARVYRDSTDSIPIVRQKVAAVFEKSRLSPNSYEGKVLQQVFETFPRDELFQSDTGELYETTMSIAHINERHRVRLFMRKDPNGYFVSALLYIPRDIYSSQIRLQVTDLIGDRIGSQSVEFYTHFSESILVRTYLIFKLQPGIEKAWELSELQRQVIALTRSWRDNLFDALKKAHGVRKGRDLFNDYQYAFSSSYREDFDVSSAVDDIELIQQVSADNPLAMHFVQTKENEADILHFKIFHWGKVLTLSDVIPVLEYMGLTVIGEHPYKIKKNSDVIWMHDFSMESRSKKNIDVSESRSLFEQSFIKIWQGYAESDDFNGLVLAAQLHWREITLLRAYAVYMKQTVFPFSQYAIANALISYPDITKGLVALFHTLFDPDLQTDSNQKQVDKLIDKILLQLDEVENLTDDRIINRYLDLIKGTLRTNYYQKVNDNEKSYMSFKFSPKKIADIPEPRPLYEIFVYSPSIEGVHLRVGKVARGGLRWSDRLEDFRTEVLGLVKAQQVKNSVIVPSGAKGGFVAKKASLDQGRDAFIKEGISCYKIFIKGLLDITDNLKKGKVIPPPSVVRLDDDDPYLVVAADKGTATFSDIANEIALEYDYWMGDAFASGGSQGYDHKGMGITARGAWVSVQRHFREKGVNIQQEDFTVIGIGDMSGDVFGNGMLLSEHIRLVAAFNHLHIFIDPEPDPAKSFAERKRLFESPQLSWNDYDRKIISQGGGVFSRQAKSIVITAEMRARFDIKGTRMTPNDLINALLKSPVDLIWNGGIGTYVKSSRETHADVGDKANDLLRVNGKELRCQVFGEGGNLGLTQLGRIEYCLNGGACNTDFIDNAAGVDCSDHEVNIKILLNDIMAKGELTEVQRNKLLANMTDDVASMVLTNNYRQTQAISVAQMEVTSRIGEYRRLISSLEDSGRLNRALEYIPTDDEIVERIAKGKSLTRPELSVLTSYVKVMLKEELAVDAIANNAYLAQSVEKEFPQRLRKKYKDSINDHILRKEIVATQVANDIVNTMGTTFCSRLTETTGDNIPAVATAYVVARDVFQLDEFRRQVDALDYQIPAEEQMKLLFSVMRRVRRGTRWFLRNRRHGLNPSVEVDFFKDTVKSVVKLMPTIITGEQQEKWQQDYEYYCSLGFTKDMANLIVMPIRLFSGLGIAEAVKISNVNIKRVITLHSMLGDKLGVYWFAHSVSNVSVKSLWQAIARESFIDDLDVQLRRLCVAVLRLSGDSRDFKVVYALWEQQHQSLIVRWNSILHSLKTAKDVDYSMFSVAIRELQALTKATENCQSLEDNNATCELGD